MSTLSHAETTLSFNEYWANNFAYTMSKVKTLNDLTATLTADKRNKGIVEKEIAANPKAAFTKPTVTLSNATTVTVTFGKDTAQINYSEFSKGVLIVNRKKITLDSSKSFYNYRAEVGNLTEAKSASLFNLLISEANAGGSSKTNKDKVWESGFVATQVTRAASIYELAQSDLSQKSPKENNLSDLLVKGYNQDFDKLKVSPDQSTFAFSCNGSSLKEVHEMYYDQSKKSYRDARNSDTTESIERLADGTYVVKSPDIPGKTILDSKGKVIKIEGAGGSHWIGTLVFMGDNFFDRGSYYRFPEIASQCCEQKGCYEKVSASWKTESGGVTAPTTKHQAGTAIK